MQIITIHNIHLISQCDKHHTSIRLGDDKMLYMHELEHILYTCPLDEAEARLVLTSHREIDPELFQVVADIVCSFLAGSLIP